MFEWAIAYEKLMGRPPTAQELHRIERIRSLLRIRDDDSFWYVIVVNEFYTNTSLKAARDIEKARSDWVAEQKQFADASILSVVSPGLRRPASFLCIMLLAMLAANSTANMVLGLQQRERTERLTTVIAAHQEQDVTARADAKIAMRTDRERTLAADLDDPTIGPIVATIKKLPLGERAAWVQAPEARARAFGALGRMASGVVDAIVAANDPASAEPLRRGQAWTWAFGRATGGDQDVDRLIAAYAAGNKRLMALVQALPSDCTTTSIETCRK